VLKIDIEIDPSPGLQWGILAPAVYSDLTFHQLAIRYNHSVPVAGLDSGLSPAYLFYKSDVLLYLDPIAYLDDVLHLEGQTRHNVAERVLKRKTDYGGKDS
jgi:hypothetical protein